MNISIIRGRFLYWDEFKWAASHAGLGHMGADEKLLAESVTQTWPMLLLGWRDWCGTAEVRAPLRVLLMRPSVSTDHSRARNV